VLYRSRGDAVSPILQSYADRGVFRGFRATPGARGRVDYSFTWLFRRPMLAVFHPSRSVVAFPALFPGVAADSALKSGLAALVSSRASRSQPAHKRVDARRARLSCSVRRGDWSLAVHIRGNNHEYAVRKAVNLINELCLLLRETYPDYLISRFDLSTE
jgi:hypothetical protein